VFDDMLANDPRPFFMHQSNLTGDRLGYPVMDGVLGAYRAVFAPGAPAVHLPMSGDGEALHRQDLWARALTTGTAAAWVQGTTLTIAGPPGTQVPVTAPAGTDAVPPYGGADSGWVTLGARPLKLRLRAEPFRAVPAGKSR
jgi:hypothetical protein